MNKPFDLEGIIDHDPAATQYFINEVAVWLLLTNDPRDPRDTKACADFAGFMRKASKVGFECDWRRYLELTK